MSGYKISEEDLLRDIRGLAIWKGHDPSIPEYDEFGKHGSTTVSNRLGTWCEAKKKAGVTEQRGFLRGDYFYKNISDLELREELERLEKNHGYVSAPVMSEFGEYSVSTYNERFGSWNQALRKNGLDIVEDHSHETEDLVEVLRILGEDMARRPTYHDVNEHTNVSSTSFYTHFDSFDDALEAAGFEPRRKAVYCDYCGARISRQRSTILENEHFYCGRDCHGAWLSENRAGRNSWNWKGGGSWDYGPNWEEQRKKALERDEYKCRACGKEEQEHWRSLAVHHMKRIQYFKQNYDAPEWYEKANALHNLVTYCDECHSRWEGVPVAPQSKV